MLDLFERNLCKSQPARRGSPVFDSKSSHPLLAHVNERHMSKITLSILYTPASRPNVVGKSGVKPAESSPYTYNARHVVVSDNKAVGHHRRQTAPESFGKILMGWDHHQMTPVPVYR